MCRVHLSRRVASSTTCFAAEHRPLYRKHLQKYDVQFRKLIRRIVGPPPGTNWSAQWHDILHEWNLRVGEHLRGIYFQQIVPVGAHNNLGTQNWKRSAGSRLWVTGKVLREVRFNGVLRFRLS